MKSMNRVKREKTTKAVVAMLCKIKTISLLEYFILF